MAAGTNSKLKVAKEGGQALIDASKDLSLDSDTFIPKIYRSIHSTSTQTISHGLTYPPQYLFMREITTSPKKYAYGLDEFSAFSLQKMPDIGVTASNLYIGKFPAFVSGTPIGSISADVGMWALLMMEPCKNPTTQPAQTQHPNPVFKLGDDVNTDPDYLLRIDSKYDSFKVAKSNLITLNLPTWNAPAATTAVDPDTGFDYVVPATQTVTASDLHGLSYVPYYQPFVPYKIDLTEVYANDIPSTVNINGLVNIFSPNFAFVSEGYSEEVYVWVNDSRVYIDYTRNNIDTSSGHTFPARTITMDYTVFYNRVDEEFNLL